MKPLRFYLDGRVTPNDANFELGALTPGKVYIFRSSMDLGWYLVEKREGLSLPKKLYGTVESRASRVLRTFAVRKQLGVVMYGLKGSGKSLLAAKILLDSGLPIIDIDVAVPLPALTNFFSAIGPVAVRFDEFEKVLDKDEQVSLLAFLDSTHSAPRLVVATANEESQVLDPFKNRPGRFWYSFKYSGLEESFVREYLADHLQAPDEYLDAILAQAEALGSELSFDALRAMAEETNLWHTELSPKEILEPLNAQPKPVMYQWRADFSWSEPFEEVFISTGVSFYEHKAEDVAESLGHIYGVSVLVASKKNVGTTEEEDRDDDKESDIELQKKFGNRIDGYHRYNVSFTVPNVFIASVERKKVTYRFPVLRDHELNFPLFRELGISSIGTTDAGRAALKKAQTYKELDLVLTLERTRSSEFRRWVV
jgi:SpoVK/Ycf46/Vps4 family AAA+-type ATPase